MSAGPYPTKMMFQRLQERLLALASTIALLELSLAGNRVSSESFMPVPVLTTVSADQLQAFRAFAGDYAHRLGWDGAADWCRGARSAAA